MKAAPSSEKSLRGVPTHWRVSGGLVVSTHACHAEDSGSIPESSVIASRALLIIKVAVCNCVGAHSVNGTCFGRTRPATGWLWNVDGERLRGG